MTDSLERNLLHDPARKSDGGGQARGAGGPEARTRTAFSSLPGRRAGLSSQAGGGQESYFFFAFFFETFLFTAFLWAFFAMFNSPSLRVVSPPGNLFPRRRRSLSDGMGAL
jgi:hypothetical protein